MRTLRSLLFLGLILPLTLVGFTFTMVGLLFPRRLGLDYPVARAWARCLVWTAGCRVRVEGHENVLRGHEHLIVANHASILDPPVLIGWLPTRLRFVMKRELAWLPFVGWYAKAAGHFFVDRERTRAGKETVRAAATTAHGAPRCLVVFPEGTRSADGRLQALKTGSFELALAAGLPLQPVALLGTHPILPKGSWGPRRGGTATLRIGPPIHWEDLEGSTGRRALATRAREALLALGVPDGSETA